MTAALTTGLTASHGGARGLTGVYDLGPFRLDAAAGALTQGGTPVALGSRAVAVLTSLVTRANEFVPKAAILDAAWPGLVVEESNLAVQIFAIRRALARVPGGAGWIETLPRRGYRFVGPVIEVRDEPSRTTVGSLKRTNLPQPLTSFIGRERERLEIKGLLTTKRMLSVVGAGGIGKTRLVLTLAAELIDAYRDGVWLVELGSIRDPSLVPTTVAQALGLPEKAGIGLIEALCAYLEPRRVVLILDNCEHLLEACASLAEALLQGAAETTIIATSREPLRVTGEQIYPLQPLSLPDPEANAETTASSEAVQLFVERAQRQQPSFALTEARAPVVARLCIHLDGIPLAVELAAARVRSLSVEQINARIDDRFRLLTEGSRTELPRHQTLRATLDWSFDLLAEDERAVLRRLAIFAGGFTLEAASVVASDEVIDEHAVIDLLTQLVSRSLVIADAGDDGTRYRLLETTRAYASEKLAEAGEADTIRHRHAQYFRDRFEPAYGDWLRMPDAEWHGIYPPELDNVRAALGWALASGDAEIAIALAGATRVFWTGLSLLSEGRQWLGVALDRVDERSSLPHQARLWAGLGGLWSTAAPARAAAATERGVELYRRLGDTLNLGISLVALGRIWVFMGRFEQATAALGEALPLVEGAAVPKALARYFETLAFLKMLTGDLVGARPHFEQALSLYRGAGAESATLGVLVNLADLTWALGDLDAALARCREAIALMRNAARVPKDMLGHGLTNLAGIHTERGELGEALAAAREGLPMRRQTDMSTALDHLAWRAGLAGEVASAARLAGYVDATRIARLASRQPNEVRARNRLQALLVEKLEQVELDRLLAEGAKMSEDEAFRLALER